MILLPVFDEMIEGLDEDEKKVLTLIFQRDMAENKIAVEMHKSAAWVTKTKKKAIAKLHREFFEGERQ